MRRCVFLCSVLWLLLWQTDPARAAAAALAWTPQGDLVLFEDHADQRRAPASLVKCMTALLVCDAAANGTLRWEAPVAAPPDVAAVTGARLGLVPGQEVPAQELLAALLIGSANDAAVALAVQVAGSVHAFVTAMNARAAGLGLTGTRFATPHGLPAPNQYTTARDMARLAWALLEHYPYVVNFSAMPSCQVRGVALYNRNDLLHLPGVDGLKTGATAEAGACLILTALRQERRVIVVLLGARDAAARAKEAAALLEQAFAALPQ
ncbi:D-alanyl-D-alanine carboxypeptidase family protein [Megalodesulfovibrio gigas]|nr:serine hydrolase [Megalodesulfovibrio gigas]